MVRILSELTDIHLVTEFPDIFAVIIRGRNTIGLAIYFQHIKIMFWKWLVYVISY
jgi:hypothetical protein